MNTRSRHWMLSACTLALGLLAACTTARRHEWLTVFFDGVPALDQAGSNAPPPAAALPASPPPGAAPPPRRATPEFVVHQPYLEHDCRACHISSRSQQMKGPLLDVCFSCHDDFTRDARVVHEPARQGDCTACHEPHLSPYAMRLLKSKLADLCMDCHDPLNDKPVVHAPVKQGDCLACHSPHASAHGALLTAAGDALCLGCHDQADMAGLTAHAERGGQTCVDCHEPHQAERKGLLK